MWSVHVAVVAVAVERGQPPVTLAVVALALVHALVCAAGLGQ